MPHAAKAATQSRHALVVIILAQLLGTSLWFSVNSAAEDLMQQWSASPSSIGVLTIATQLGFISGTLIFALSGLADRFAAHKIFATCALLGAVCNLSFVVFAHDVATGAIWRLLVGLCLSGIYPIGMKLVVGWAPHNAGKALAWLVGMLTLGTALPQGIKAIGSAMPWQMPLLVASGLAAVAAGMILRLGQGHTQPGKAASILSFGAVLQAFSIKEFRSASFGYFGHMWELYAMWTLTPLLIAHADLASHLGLSTATVAFSVIAAGALGCIIGGQLSTRHGSARVAAAALAMSATCCLIFPLIASHSAHAGVALMLLWGASVVADSPQFSALAAGACPRAIVGSALSMQNAIGFAITVVAIGLTTQLVEHMGLAISWILLPGPLLGLIALMPLLRKRWPAGPAA
ncbi:MFS transporter [Xanthomonas campestris pv. campestris]